MSFPYELQFPLEKQYLKLHKIITDKDVTIIFFFFFGKPKILCSSQKSVFQEVLKNMKRKRFFPPCAMLEQIQSYKDSQAQIGLTFVH